MTMTSSLSASTMERYPAYDGLVPDELARAVDMATAVLPPELQTDLPEGYYAAWLTNSAAVGAGSCLLRTLIRPDEAVYQTTRRVGEDAVQKGYYPVGPGLVMHIDPPKTSFKTSGLTALICGEPKLRRYMPGEARLILLDGEA